MKNRYSSHITFLYYNDFEKGCKFIEDVLDLECVMDQGFARLYRVGSKSFVGAVKINEGSIEAQNKGGTLISLNTNDVESEYHRVKEFEPKGLTEIKFIEQIPLKSFFFKDDEGYDFEIQQFLKEEDLLIF